MKKSFLADLNEDQLLAATTTEGPVLILAGAGSGKTKTIISRTVNIISTNKIDPRNILIMTFTNKAAREMRERGEKMLEAFENWNGFMPEFTTFHSWGVKFIRSLDGNILASKKLNQYFNISDESDQVVILNKILQSLISEDEMKKIKIKNLLLPIGFIQNNLVQYDSIENATKGISLLLEEDSSWIDEVMTLDKYDIKLVLSELYFQYKKELRANNLIDFEDLINIPIEVISENIEIKNRLRNYYKYIMVDEFQDTNGSQLELLNLLTSEDENICVVGDDSQSIYGWRGANIEYILNFHKARKNVTDLQMELFQLPINF
jgi:DNA helicase-2/ATP-dependent DNA helicase PcrA